MEINFTNLKQKIPKRMKLVRELVKRHEGEQPFTGVTALLIQHQLGNQYVQARALIELGLDPKDLYWLDIPYTSNAIVREAMFKLGIPVENFCTSTYRVLDFYAPYQRKRMHEFVRKFHLEPPDKLLVLDDGAYYLESAVCFEKQTSELAIVEQTTRGLIKMQDNSALRFAAATIPVVDVAGSDPKKTLEPPFIGKAVCAGLIRKLRRKFKGDHGYRCLILGHGAIGKQVVRFVNENLGFRIDKIHVFDPRLDDESSELCRYRSWERDDLKTRFDLVIGCSGRSSFGVGDYVYLNDGAFLASASSGSVELSRRDFIELADNNDIDDIWIQREGLDESNIHSDIHIHLPGRNVTFVNAGFPVNFDGRVNCVPARYIQATMAMMVMAAIQAVTTTRTGLIPLDTNFCDWLDKAFRKLLGKEAAVLL